MWSFKKLYTGNTFSFNVTKVDTHRSPLTQSNITINLMSLIHININGLNNKTTQLEAALSNYVNCNLLCLTEHHLTASEYGSFILDNFRISSIFCRGTSWGGSAILTRNIETVRRQDIETLSILGHVECSGINVVIGNELICIVCIYRPPSGDMLPFMNTIRSILKSCAKQRYKIIITGDFNINTLENSNKSLEFIELFSLNNCSPLIFEPTRVTEHSSTLIDNIFVKNDLLPIINKSYVVDLYLSDHKAVCIDLEYDSTPPKSTTRFCRSYNDKNIKKFYQFLENESWESIMVENNANELFNNFHAKYLFYFNESFPLKSKKVKYKVLDSEWKTTGLKISQQKLRLLNKLQKVDPTYYTKTYVKRYHKIYHSLVKLSKSKVNISKINSSDNKSKAMWNIINTRHCALKNKNDINKITVNGVDVEDPALIVKEFSDHFTQKVDDIKNEINNKANNLNNLNHTNNIFSNPSSMFFSPLTTKELLDIINDMKNKRSYGFDEVPDFIFKKTATAIIEVLTYIINQCFSSGVFPCILKQSVIKPIFKKGDKYDIQNYRPISLLSVFSKVFEKCFLTRLLSFLNQFDILSKYQHGFRQNFSTESAIFHLVSGILDDINKNKKTAGIFLDLTKAFDCVDHAMLLHKLNKYGIRSNCFEFIKSYLLDRSQTVVMKTINKNNTEIICKSKSVNVKFGVPQGSILGPVLFLLYINDLPNYCTIINTKPTVYADDSNAQVSADNNEILKEKITNTVPQIEKWFTLNGLLMNRSKTELMSFNPIQCKNVLTGNLEIEDDSFEFKEYTKFLGIYIDQNLRWTVHTDYLRKKLPSIIFAINELRNTVDLPTLKVLYYSNFHSFLTYGIIFWGNSIDFNHIFILQKKALRTMLKLHYLTSCKKYFVEQGILSAPCIYIFQCVTYVKKNYENFYREPNHIYPTRKRNLLRPPTSRLQLVENGPSCQCMILYNNLPEYLTAITCYKNFRKQTRKFLVQKCYYSVNEYITDKF
jgi:exonuclease III